MFRGAGNDEVLHSLILSMGFRIPHQSVRDVLMVLERSGALIVTVRERLLVVEITRHGSEVASGLVDMEGVARPGPECPC